MGSTGTFIGQQLYFHSAILHGNDTRDVIDCPQVVIIYSFTKEIKLNIRASYIVFLLVKSKTNNFIKKIKHVLRAFITLAKFVRILKQVHLGFSLICSRILPNIRLGFHKAMKARTTCFTSLIKYIFIGITLAFSFVAPV